MPILIDSISTALDAILNVLPRIIDALSGLIPQILSALLSALPKLIDKDGTYKLKKGFVFGNDNNMKQIDNLHILPIYLIMFV